MLRHVLTRKCNTVNFVLKVFQEHLSSLASLVFACFLCVNGDVF